MLKSCVGIAYGKDRHPLCAHRLLCTHSPSCNAHASKSPRHLFAFAPLSNLDSEMTTRRSLAWNLCASPALGASLMRPSCKTTTPAFSYQEAEPPALLLQPSCI